MIDQRDDDAYDAAVAELRRRLDGGLDEPRLREVRRRVRSGIAGTRSMTRWPIFAVASAGLAVAVTLFAVVWLMRPTPTSEIAATPAPRISMTIVMSSAPTFNATALADIAAGQSRSVGNDERLDIRVGVTARLSIAGPASLSVMADGHFAMTNGVASVSVTKQAPGQQFAMAVGDAMIVVHGTRFDVAAAAGVFVGVRVSEGTVELRPAQGPPIMLGAGTSSGTPPTVWDTDPFAASWWQESQSDDEQVSNEHADEARTHPHGVKGGAPKDAWELAAKAAARGECRDVAAHVTRLVGHTKDDNEAARALMLEADCWLRGSEKARALASLDRIAAAYPNAATAASALFEAAKTRAELHMDREAIDGFALYLTRYSTGTFAEAASFRRCELTAKTDGHAAATTCLQKHLHDFAAGRRVGDAILLIGSFACADEKWDSADAAYWQYIARVPAERDDVDNLRSLLRCLSRGHVPDLDRASGAFTARHPTEPGP